MGLFDGLKGGSKSAKFDIIDPISTLPPFLREPGRGISGDAFELFRNLISSGESRASEELFSRARTGTIEDFRRETGQANLNFGRIGAGSSGARDKRQAALSLSFGNLLGAQDTAREEALLGRQQSGASQGLNAIFGFNRATTLVPQTKTKGLFDGFGTGLIKGGLTAAATAFGGPTAGAITSSGFGGGGGGGAGLSQLLGNIFGGGGGQVAF